MNQKSELSKFVYGWNTFNKDFHRPKKIPNEKEKCFFESTFEAATKYYQRKNPSVLQPIRLKALAKQQAEDTCSQMLPRMCGSVLTYD